MVDPAKAELEKAELEKASKEREVPERAAWASPTEFILTCLNYAVGLGNVWRFPYLVYRNGGGAFLVPYIIMLFTMGLPIFFLELIVGQYSALGPNTAFMRMAPLFHGLGYCALAVISMITIYYQVIVAWTIFYTYASFDAVLGWGVCTHDYNTPACFSSVEDQKCRENVDPFNTSTFVTYFNLTCKPVEEICAENSLVVYTQTECQNASGFITPIRYLVPRTLASEEYYNDYAMGINGATWEDWGILRWQMVVCLLLAWIICYLCVIKGVATMGKVVYFTSVFPYVILTALLIRGATLPGAYEGIMFYITPKWELLLNASVWGDAASQTFYALGIGCGSLVTLASYNKFNNNCHRDALFVGIVNMLTSIYAGFAIFSILGFMAYTSGVPVDEVVKDGPGLAFIAYPEAVLMMPLPQLWAVLFFLMLFILGLGSQFGGVEAISTAIIDRWPWLRTYNYIVTGCICLACFLLALPMCCEGGVYLFTLLDWNTATWGIMMVGFFEIGLAAWVFGIDDFMGLIKEMEIFLPKTGRGYWMVMWVAVAPIFIIGIVIFTFIDYSPAYYSDYVFPHWVDILGWMIASTSLVPLPCFGLYRVIHNYRKGGKFMTLLQKSPKWGPQKNWKTPVDGVTSSTAALQMYDNVSYQDEEKDGKKTSEVSFDNGGYKDKDEYIDGIFMHVNSY